MVVAFLPVVVLVYRDGAAALGNRTADVLELHGGVRNVKMVRQHAVEGPQNGVARRGRHVGDEHVAA